MGRFDEIEEGQTAEIRHVITVEDLKKFAELTGDDNRLHMDSDFASKTIFKKPVVHGMLGASFISTVIGTKLPGDGALWFSQNLEFVLPVRIGDHLTIKAEVTNKENYSRVVTIKTTIFNQDKQVVTKGTAKVKIIEEEQQNSCDLESNANKTALVIGATGGIGSAVCLELAASGFDVMIHYHKNLHFAHKLSNEITALGRKAYICSGDIVNRENINEIVNDSVQRLGSVSVLVNCATPRIQTIKFSELKWEDFNDHLDTQVKATFYLIQSICPYMEKQKYGKIINIITQALESPLSSWLPYITAKGALMGFSKALAYELAPKGIRLNMISPSMTDTELISNIPERVRKVTAAKTPLRRLATPQAT